MSVRAGREVLSIPGPTTVPDEVLAAMHRPAVDIYTGSLVDVTMSLLEDLRRLFSTRGRTYIYAANGHGAWEAALTNVLSRGDKVLVLESGRFAVGWGEMATKLGAEVEVLAGDYRRAVRPAEVEARLRADKANAIKAILVVQIDTASGVVNDISAISTAVKAAGHPALLMVDVVASLGCVPFEMDGWEVDVAVAGSQKGLMTPPGLGFVAAGERAVAAHKAADMVTPYWDWTFREGPEHYQKYCGTPPEHLLFGLRKAIDMLDEEGLEQAFERHRLLAEATRRAVAVWAEGRVLAFSVIEPAERANSVTTILWSTARGGKHELRALVDYARERCGVVLGTGIGELNGKAFRIAHMGHANAPMVLGTLAVVEMGLTALGVPHGAGGVDAAVAYLGKAVRP
jgi:alanine-glyoxylate transaminase/serine-glyoxylate transaminase/serine-pyruvate transaminase